MMIFFKCLFFAMYSSAKKLKKIIKTIQDANEVFHNPVDV